MSIFYRGAGVDIYWHINNPTEIGFTARAPEVAPTTARLIQHISRGTNNSPFISLSISYAIARDYAILSSPEIPTQSKPAYVYEIEFQDPLPYGLEVLDPVKEVAQILPSPPTIGASLPARRIPRIPVRRCKSKKYGTFFGAAFAAASVERRYTSST